MASLKFFLLAAFSLIGLTQAAHNQTDFLSIDCGSSNSSYIDESTGFLYLSDTSFIETGKNGEVAELYKAQLVNQRQFLTVRSFPEGNINCYALKPTLGKYKKYLIRARFMYGNYDNKNHTPTFDIYLGVDLWDTVTIQADWATVDKEVIFLHESDDDIQVCLVNTGFGVPFISVLELRPLDNEMYVSKTGSLQLIARVDLNPSTNQLMRYEDDDYDRIWAPLTTDEWTSLNLSDSRSNISENSYKIPSEVMRSAYKPNTTNAELELIVTLLNSSTEAIYYIYFHFAEIELLPKNESREFNIFVNGNFSHGPISPTYLTTTTLVVITAIETGSDGKIQILLNKTKNSTQQPLLNAVEIYSLAHLSRQETNLKDGFLSIDCGSSNSSYVDEDTGFLYVSDTNFVETGENREIAEAYKVQLGNQQSQFMTLRSFPLGVRNCYNIKKSLQKGTKYMVRARFLYGNYDSKGETPTFDLYLGVDRWDTVIFEAAWAVVDKEITFFPRFDDDLGIDVCLVNTGFGVPFVSALELRPWDNKTYVSETGSLQLVARIDLNPPLAQMLRYKEDIYDRVWSPFTADVWTPLNTSAGNKITKNIYQLPSQIMSTAYTPNKSVGSFGLNVNPVNSTPASKFYFYFHIAEIQLLPKNESREINIFMNGELSHGPFVPSYLVTTTLVSTLNNTASDGFMRIRINQTKNSTQPPILNAMEVYLVSELSQEETDHIDVKAILGIQSAYGVKRNWQGDPCNPVAYLWDGLQCTYSEDHLPRISSLNLSSSGLEGEISSYIANLTMLQYLDLSNNNLTGTLPAFLAKLPLLRVLNSKENNLKGPIPAALLERSKNGLSLSVDDNLMGNESPPSRNNNTDSSSVRFLCGKDKLIVPMIALLYLYFS